MPFIYVVSFYGRWIKVRKPCSNCNRHLNCYDKTQVRNLNRTVKIRKLSSGLETCPMKIKAFCAPNLLYGWQFGRGIPGRVPSKLQKKYTTKPKAVKRITIRYIFLTRGIWKAYIPVRKPDSYNKKRKMIKYFLELEGEKEYSWVKMQLMKIIYPKLWRTID